MKNMFLMRIYSTRATVSGPYEQFVFVHFPNVYVVHFDALSLFSLYSFYGYNGNIYPTERASRLIFFVQILNEYCSVKRKLCQFECDAMIGKTVNEM